MYVKSCFIIVVMLIAVVMGCSQPSYDDLNVIAEKYVKLCLEFGQYDHDFIDYYYGPEEWKLPEISEDSVDTIPWEEFKNKTMALIDELDKIDTGHYNKLYKGRVKNLYGLLTALKTRIQIMNDENLSYDEESKGLYGVVAPDYPEDYFDRLAVELDKFLPGKGTIIERYKEMGKKFDVPNEKLEEIFLTVLKEAKERTKKYLTFAPNDSCHFEMVHDVPFGANCAYKGNNFSVIEVSGDYPSNMTGIVDLICHETYPGHHVQAYLVDSILYKENGWIENAVSPLFGPLSLLMEGASEAGIEMVFPGNEKLELELNVLFPMAGLDTTGYKDYKKARHMMGQFRYYFINVYKQYFGKVIDSTQAVNELTKYNNISKKGAEATIGMARLYGTYIINYTTGKDIVTNYLERNSNGDVNKKWELLHDLFTYPHIPDDIM